MTCRGLGLINPEDTVPDRQAEAEILICLSAVHRMMYPVHVGCDDQLAQNTVDARRNLPVCMIELSEGINVALAVKKQD